MNQEHSTEKDAADALRRVGYLEYLGGKDDPEWCVLLNDAAPVVARMLAEAWDAAAAWVDENDPGWGEQVRDANPYRPLPPAEMDGGGV